MSPVQFTAVLRGTPSPRAVDVLGRLALGISLVGGLGLILLVAWMTPSALPYLFGTLIVGIAGWWLFRHPLLNLCVLLTSFLLIAGYEDGTQITEVFWGLYYLAFVGYWFVTRMFFYRESIFRDRESRAIGLFLVLMTASFGLTRLFGGDLRLFMGEWLSLSFLSLYYPIREAMERERRGVWAVALSLVLVGVVILAQNALNYRELLVQATFVWQLTKGRAVINTAILMLPLFGCLAWFLQSERWSSKLGSLALFLMFLGGVIVSQARGHWLAFVFACLVLVPLLKARGRKRLFLLGGLSAILLGGAGYVVLGESFSLVAIGILDRALSIGTAATQDISLINRFLETKAVFAKVLENPILGYGMGVKYSYWNITFIPPFVSVDSFLHNGYLALWYKFGIWGLGLVTYVWGSSMVRGIRVYRSAESRLHQMVGLAGSALLISFLISAITSNPFYVNDTMYTFAVSLGLVAGVSARASRQASERPRLS